MSLSEDDPMQLYQKFTESFNKIAKPDENGENQTKPSSDHNV